MIARLRIERGAAARAVQGPSACRRLLLPDLLATWELLQAAGAHPAGACVQSILECLSAASCPQFMRPESPPTSDGP